MGFKIVVDSCGDLTEEMKKDSRFVSVPLTIVVDGEEMIDDESFDQTDCLKKMDASPECPKSSCPSPERYREIFLSGEDHYYVVTLSEQLSGSYNSARLGRDLAMEENPNLKVHIFNSKSASIGETLIASHILECEEKGMDFEKVVKDTERYITGQKIFFVLENLDVLRKNGRLSHLKSLVASALKIRPVLSGTKEGNICQLSQARGINKALSKMIDFVVEQVKDSEHRTLAIAYCNCKERALKVKEEILKRINVKKIVLVKTGGVSTMYANDGGIIVAI